MEPSLGKSRKLLPSVARLVPMPLALEYMALGAAKTNKIDRINPGVSGVAGFL
jgi:hypothetical protein